MQVGDRLDRVMSAFGYGSALDRAENADAQLSRKALVFWTVFDVLVGVIGIQALTGQLGVGGVSSWIVAAASGALLLGKRVRRPGLEAQARHRTRGRRKSKGRAS